MILVSADLHLTDNPRDAYRFDFMRRLPGIIKRQGVECLLVLGDLTEAKDRHSGALVNKIVDHMHALSQLCPIVLVRGNHDGLTGEDPFFAFLGAFEEITWVNHPLDAKNLPSAPLAGLGKVLFLPHTPNYKRDWAKVPLKGYNWIFTHNTFHGAHTDNGQVLSGIPPSVVAGSDKTISGDIHVPQGIGTVTYVGAPHRIDFGDSFSPRVLLIEKGSMRSLKMNGPQKRLIECEVE